MQENFDVEIIATILEYASSRTKSSLLPALMRSRLVSRRWKAAAATTFQRWAEKQIDEAAHRMICVYRQRFSFSTFWNCSEKELRCLMVCAADMNDSFFESVKTFWLNSCTNRSLSWVTRKFPNLTGIVMDARKINEPSLELLSSLGSQLPQLSAVGFGYQCLLSEDEVTAILSNVANLKSLSLGYAYGCTDGIFASLQSRNYKLEFLDLSNFHLNQQRNLVAFLETQDQLRSINLSNIRHVGDRTLRTIGAVCKHLEELELLWAIHCTALGLMAVLEGCPCITRLRSPGWGNQALSVLPDKCPSIAVLRMDLKKVSLSALNGLSRCTEVRDLHLNVTGVADERWDGTNDPIWEAVGNLRKVERLSLWYTTVSDAGLQAIWSGMGSVLTSCSLNNISGFSDTSLIRFVANSPLLKDLFLTHIDAVGDTFFEGLATLSTLALETLDVDCTERGAFSTKALLSFLSSSAARKLSSLTLDSSSAVNDEVLKFLATTARCRTTLSSLSIANACIHDGALIALVNHCPELGLLDIRVDRSAGPLDRKVSNTFIDYLVQSNGSSTLYYINCWGCYDISLEAARRFVKACPDVMFNCEYSDEDLGVTKSKSRIASVPLQLPQFDE